MGMQYYAVDGRERAKKLLQFVLRYLHSVREFGIGGTGSVLDQIVDQFVVQPR